MKRRITLREKDIEYTLRISNRARHMRLTVYNTGDFVVTIPRSLRHLGFIEKFIVKKSRWVLKQVEKYKNAVPRINLKNSRQEYLENKTRANDLAEERIEYFNKFYNFAFRRISIRNQKTRWGSCSRKGNLNFNYKIANLTPELRDYIIVHELCHLRELNHSPRFWNLVSQTVPNYKERRRDLRKNYAL